MPSSGEGVPSDQASIPLPAQGGSATAADGRILFDSDAVNFVRHVFAVRADGSDLVQLTSGTSNDTEPVVSPDGSTIVFTSDRAGLPQLFAMNVATMAVHALGTPDDSGQAAFSPDGKTIAFHSNYVVYLMNVDGSAQRQVIDSMQEAAQGGEWAGSGSDYQHPVFMPDGQGLLVDQYNLRGRRAGSGVQEIRETPCGRQPRFNRNACSSALASSVAEGCPRRPRRRLDLLFGGDNVGRPNPDQGAVTNR